VITMRHQTVTELPLRLDPVEPDSFLDPPPRDGVVVEPVWRGAIEEGGTAAAAGGELHAQRSCRSMQTRASSR
jgi:hypothetical protein